MVQAVLLFGSQTWVVTPRTGRALGELHEQVAQHLTVRILRRKTDKMWEYTSAGAAREEAGLQTMEDYIWR